MNIDKYIDNVTSTDYGLIFKDNKAFDNDFDAICYVPEAGLEELEEYKSEERDFTDKELVEQYIGYSRNSLRQLILEYMQQYKPKFSLEDVVKSKIDVTVFQICDWQCLETFLGESEIEYDYIPFDCLGEVIEKGDSVLYHDTEKDENNPEQKVVWEVLNASPTIIKISSEIGVAYAPPQEVEVINT